MSKNFYQLLDTLKVAQDKVDPENVPESPNTTGVPQANFPLYGELLVVEQEIVDAAESLVNKLQNLLVAIATEVKAAHNISLPLHKIIDPVLDALDNFNILRLYSGVVTEFSKENSYIAEIATLIEQNPEYDRETLITAEGSMKLRIAAWGNENGLREAGVVGDDVYELVEAIRTEKPLVKNSKFDIYDISPQAEIFPQLNEVKETYQAIAAPDFLLRILLYTRLGLIFKPSILSSTEEKLIAMAAGEFPVKESKVVQNPNEAEQEKVNEDGTPATQTTEEPKQTRKKKSDTTSEET